MKTRDPKSPAIKEYIRTVQIREKLLSKEDVAIQFIEIKEALSVDTRPTQVGQSDVCAI